jgi:hypothetical protein
MVRIVHIAWQSLKQNLSDPIVGVGVLLFVGGQELAWRLGSLSIDSPQSVSLSMIQVALHSIGGVVAISVGSRAWQRNRFDQSIENEHLPPSGPTQSYFGRAFALICTLLIFTLLCVVVAWVPTLQSIAAMRPAFGASFMEQVILGSAAASFAMLLGPLLGALTAGVFWVASLGLPLVMGNLIYKYSPARQALLELSDLISLQRLHLIDAYAIADGVATAPNWPQLCGYAGSAAGFFFALGYLFMLRARHFRG